MMIVFLLTHVTLGEEDRYQVENLVAEYLLNSQCEGNQLRPNLVGNHLRIIHVQYIPEIFDEPENQ